MDIYKQAAILKLKFPAAKGELSIEQLFELPLTSTVGALNLDDIARATAKLIKEDSVESFVAPSTTTKAQKLNLLRLEILKDVIAHKQTENAAKLDAAAKANERARLIALLDKKEDAALENLTPDEIRKRIDALG